MKKVTKIDKLQPSQTSKKKLRVAAYCRVSTDLMHSSKVWMHRKSTIKTTSPPVMTGPLQALL